MPLDSALYTLLVRPRAAEPGWIDLDVYASNDSIPTLKAYALHKDDRDGTFNAYDPYTFNRLGTSAIAPPSLPNAKPNPKHRLTRLFGPDAEVHLWNQPGLGWSWDMEWEETRYVWTREVGNLLSGERGFTLSASRKPDPNFPILQYHPHRKGGSIEILDHNVARIEPRIRDRKGLEVASLLALCYFIEHLFPVAPVPPQTPAAATTPKPAEPVPCANQPSGRKKEEKAAPAPPATVRDKPAPSTSPSRPRSPSPRASPRIDITDLSPKAVEAHYRYCLALLGDPTLPALELACRDPAGEDTLKALAERIKRKRLKLSRGSDSLDIQVSPVLPQQAEQARGGWFGFFQADSGMAAQSAATGISIRLSRVPPTTPAPSSSQHKAPIDRSTSSSSPSLPRPSSAAPPPRKVSPRPPAPPPRPVQVPKPTSRGDVPTKVGTSSGSANPAPSAPQSGGSGWLSMFGQRAKG